MNNIVPNPNREPVRINERVLHRPENDYVYVCKYKGRLSEDNVYGKKGDVMLRPVSWGEGDYTMAVSFKTIIFEDTRTAVFVEET